ncbi:hypothetical protein CISG_00059 [Coccidioides immitis RMSCC 3703]|uniref:Uncharacterized protein n=1 Tax=Coccidioides immitis RMSCC 3703 TaxID=454286 RepID=A0A0J8QHC3_COCIT|nr:hypothetical protein CISG_00059 [Coccidioides immitis RMSCC 3703]
MNFAPYQDESPDVERALSPSIIDANRTKSARSSPPVQNVPVKPFPLRAPLPAKEEAVWSTMSDVSAFETSLPLPLGVEAMLAYLLLPPAGGVFLLLVEHKSDYVRFHAWQSGMLFTTIFIIHMLFAWTSIISWLLFIADICLIAFLAAHAYRDVDTLDHYEVPFFGRLANSFVDAE